MVRVLFHPRIVQAMMFSTLFDHDFSYAFLLNKDSLRGRFVRLQDVSTQVVSQHAYPGGVAVWLSRFMAATVGLASLMKFNGIFTLQTKSDGPLSLVVVDVNSEGHVRGYAQHPEGKDVLPSLHDALGKGYLAFTVDQRGLDDRYQGIVALEGESLPHAIEHYFEQSEQLKTRCLLFSRKHEDVWQSAALIIQQMPEKDPQEETWAHVEALLATLKEGEAFETEPHILLHRLFHELGPVIVEAREYTPQCRCSMERVKDFLLSLPEEDREDLLKDGPLEMRCEFCNHMYLFNRADLMPIH